jgi:hypothetical protein
MWQDEHLENASDLSLDSSSNKQKVNNLLNDPRSFRVKIKDHSGFVKNITLFSTGPFGSTIRNAVTGIKYVGDMVGTQSEDLYFKVRFATGESGIEAATLFYDNPEQFEKHQFQDLSQNIKKNWHDKFLDVKYGVTM